jgi:hypothetical protein
MANNEQEENGSKQEKSQPAEGKHQPTEWKMLEHPNKEALFAASEAMGISLRNVLGNAERSIAALSNGKQEPASGSGISEGSSCKVSHT